MLAVPPRLPLAPFASVSSCISGLLSGGTILAGDSAHKALVLWCNTVMQNVAALFYLLRCQPHMYDTCYYSHRLLQVVVLVKVVDEPQPNPSDEPNPPYDCSRVLAAVCMKQSMEARIYQSWLSQIGKCVLGAGGARRIASMPFHGQHFFMAFRILCRRIV